MRVKEREIEKEKERDREREREKELEQAKQTMRENSYLPFISPMPTLIPGWGQSWEAEV